jgi:hypothetical protein
MCCLMLSAVMAASIACIAMRRAPQEGLLLAIAAPRPQTMLLSQVHKQLCRFSLAVRFQCLYRHACRCHPVCSDLKILRL